LKRFRTLCRRGGLYKFKAGGGPLVTFVGAADGLRIRCQSPEVAIEYRQPGPSDAEAVRLPLDALEVCEGRDEAAVTIEGGSGNKVLLSWNDGGVPRQHEVVKPKPASIVFPEVPTSFVANDAELWRALHDAVATCDESNTRYALACLHLRGHGGRVEATDGRQVLVQSGYRFDWNDDVLVPGSKLLGGNDMDLSNGVGVGRAGEWVGFVVGLCTILLPIQKEARFPKIDQILPNADAAKSQLELSKNDARFLADTLPRLPSDDPAHQPITLDLNGKVLVRCRVIETGRPTEISLPSSKLTGEPVLLNMNRTYLERALKLGFDQVRLYGSNSPALCVDDRRQYLWALLDKDSAIKPSEDVVRLESSANASASRSRISKPKEVPMSVPMPAASTSPISPTDEKSARRPRTQVSTSSIEQAIDLRDTLRQAAGQASELARSLKNQKRQARIVATTLASLNELQKVAG